MKILATIGPVSESTNSIKKISSFTNLFRLNGSHNSLAWHKKICQRIKFNNIDNKILLDIPGIKPRTDNKVNINVKKNDLVIFYFKKDENLKKYLKHIKVPITNPIPKTENKTKKFSISDGLYSFKIVKLKKNIIIGKSLQSFILKPKKGLNLPNSYYDNKLQLDLYLKFLNKIKSFKFDAIGLSYVQNEKIVKKIKKKFPNHLILSKIENIIGFKNTEKISEASDMVMIDRGDLSAEIGESKLYEAVIQISNICKRNGKPLVMATENLGSMIENPLPSKSEIMSLAFSKTLNVDEIMLSDETATSKNYHTTIKWLYNFINFTENKKTVEYNSDSFLKILNNLNDSTLIVFSKKGYFIEKVIRNNNSFNLIIFSCDKKVINTCYFRASCTPILTNDFPKNMENFIFNNIKRNKNLVFKKNNNALLVFANFPKKGSRANTLSLINKENF
ncbi:pyruvate kinase [Candidatus Pelagibacter sp. HIMB1593]|uniref:pyruvate kinase n=1 Tax=Candidatus Pelagibacter sp. HIMB1593 TaxID=3413355 RepID=UPI003F829631